MSDFADILNRVRESAEQRILFLPHAIRQMARPATQIRTSEVRNVVFHGTVIEDYPEDARGHSCLVLGSGHGDRPIHVVCSPKDEYLAIITTYLPDTERWSEDYRERRRQ